MIKLNSDGDFMESVTARFEETVAFYSSVIDEGKMIFCGAELNDQKMDMDGVIFKMTLPVTIFKKICLSKEHRFERTCCFYI